jgi:hypothetical protein
LTAELDPILDLVHKCGDITDKALHMVERFAKTWNISGFDALLECRVVSESRLVEILASRTGIVRFRFDQERPEPEMAALTKIPFAEARRLRCIPLRFEENKKTFVCIVSNPLDQNVNKALAELVGCEILMLVAEKSKIDLLLNEVYPTDMQIPLTPGNGVGDAATNR